MTPDANIRAVITAKDEASAVLGSFGDKSVETSQRAQQALMIAGAAAVGFAALSIKAYADSQAQAAQVNQVLETTGKVSQISAKQVEDLAMSMERYSGKAHDSIEQGQAILLQFSQVSSKNLPEMTKAMLDLSQRMGVDTVTAAKQLGIALDSPTIGMSRLRRSGIDFTDSQKAAIKALQDSGDLAGADALLMKGLEEKVGGAAGAYRNTLAGSVDAAKNTMRDFEIQVGEVLSKALLPLLDALNKHPAILQAVIYSVLLLAAAFVTLKTAALIGDVMAAAQGAITAVGSSSLVTTGEIAGLQATAALGIVIPVAAALAALGLVIAKGQETIAVIRQMNDGIQRDTATTVAAIQQMQDLAAHGTPAQQARAQHALAGLKAQQGHAAGTNFAPGGLSLVGEQGPELVNLPRGSQVIPHNKIGGMGASVNVTFSGVFTGDKQEFRKLAIQAFKSASDAAAMKGYDMASMTTDQWRRL